MALNPSVFNATNHASTTLANKTNHANLIADETHPHVHAREPPPHSRTRPAHPAPRSRRRSPPPPPPRAARSPDARPARKFHPNRCLPDPSFAGRSNHGDGSAASAAAPPRVPPTLLSLGWVQQAWRRIRSVHGRSTSGSADQGQRPDGGVAGIGAVCCFCLRSLHLSSALLVARLLFHSDLGQTVCSHTWSASSFRRMYSCRSRAAAAEVDGMGKTTTRLLQKSTPAWGRRRRRLLQKSTPKTAAPPTSQAPHRAQVPKCSESLQTTVPTGSSRGGAEEAGQRWGRGRRPEAVGVGNRRGSRRPQKEEATRDLSNPASTAAGARSSLGHEQGDEGCAVSRGGGPRRGKQCIFPLCGRRRRWAAAAQECLARAMVAGAGCRRWLGLGAGAGLELGAATGERRKVRG